MARPKKEEKKKRNRSVQVRVTDDEYELLKMYAEYEKTTMSELLRGKAMGAVMYDAQRTVERMEKELMYNKNTN